MDINLLNKWLDEPFIVKNSTDLKKPYYNNIDLYYTKKEIKRFVVSENDYSNKDYLNKYQDKELYIHEDTRRYEADNLFKILVNHCGKFGIYDKCNEKFLFNQSNKNSFYEFVYNNSKK
jgi:hypothetical protein